MEGIVDCFREAGMPVLGPTADAARLEGSKVFAKNLLRKYGIPTAAYEAFSDPEEACAYAGELIAKGGKAVIKADGLAAGKGVIIAEDFPAACAAINGMMRDKQFGKAGERLVVEEFLEGEELSFFVMSDGSSFVPLMAAQDHKRVFDGDQGPNTGGMGAYTNPPIYTSDLKARIINEIIAPTLEAMKKEGCPYQGVLYAGLMITPQGPRVLEYNVRFGDPEAQVLMPMLKTDAYELFAACAHGNLKDFSVEICSGSCVGVILASQGYPGSYASGKLITGLEDLEADTLVFHAGTAKDQGKLVTAGGRVLAVVCRGESIARAVARVYREVEKVHFAGMHYRKDIAHRAFAKETT